MNTVPLDNIHAMLVDSLSPGETAEREFDIPDPQTFRGHVLTLSSAVLLRVAIGRVDGETFSMILREDVFVGAITRPGKYKIAVKNISNVAAAVHINVTS